MQVVDCIDVVLLINTPR